VNSTKYLYTNGTNGSESAAGARPGRNGRKSRSRSPMHSDYVWLDGELVPFEEATVHFLNPTMHYGPGVFEGIRCYATVRGPAVFRLREHLERFLHSIRILGLVDLEYSLGDLQEAVHRVVCANGFNECYIRPLLYFDGPLGLNLDAYRPVVAIAAWKWEALLGQAALETGVRMMVSSVTRMHPNAGMTKAKVSGQYVNSILAKTLAVRAGFDEAIMLDPEGYVAECTGENLLLVRDGVVYTTPRATILEGITRDTVLTLARDAGYKVVEERISRDQLYIADEVFVCGTAAEVVPVREIDYRPIGSGQPGPITRDLQQRFYATVRGQTERSRTWLDYMAVAAIV
jgi:branched-chain amino acid aminotransferase